MAAGTASVFFRPREDFRRLGLPHQLSVLPCAPYSTGSARFKTWTERCSRDFCITASSVMGANLHGGTVRLERLVWVGPLTVGASIAAVLAVRIALVALLRPPADFTPLGTDSPMVLTGALVTCACLVFLLVARFSSSPIRAYKGVALVALMLSLVPDAALIRSGGPGATWPNALALSALHVVAWAVSTWILTRLTVVTVQA